MAQSKQAKATTGLGRYIIPLTVGASLLLVATVGMFSYVGYIDHNRLLWRLTANNLNSMVPEITGGALRTVTGQKGAGAELMTKIIIANATLEKLEKGNKETGMPPVKAELRTQTEAVRYNWDKVRPLAENIASSEDAFASISESNATIIQQYPLIMAQLDEAVQASMRNGTSVGQVYLMQRQEVLVQRIKTASSELLHGGGNASVAIEKLGRDAAVFESTLSAMLSGKGSSEVLRVEDPAIRDKLRQVAVDYAAMKEAVQVIVTEGPRIIEAKEKFESLDLLTVGLVASAGDLLRVAENEQTGVNKFTILGYILAAAALLIFLLLGVVLVRDARRREALSVEQNNRNQQAILRLLDEMMNLAEGDLSQHTTVTEDITGAIADSVNYSIDALRDLVTTMKRTSVQVSATAEESRESSMRLSASSQDQAQRIEQASEIISKIANKVGEVAVSAQASAEVAGSSVEVASKGGEAVRQTIHGMESIREQIQDTSKRLKRLGESSQEVGDIVGLITDIADQTNILALNAAIQAAMAGDAGRGFAVVADEVQRLAERVGNATKQIESLVKTIQSDTQEAMLSMEQTTSNVVEGARVAENAGRSLEEIESVSSSLAQQIQQIAQDAREQLEEAAHIRETMSLISEETNVSALNSQVSANKIGQLTELAQELETSVAGFKLPESATESAAE
jgi:twitching motility protein PilJ